MQFLQCGLAWLESLLGKRSVGLGLLGLVAVVYTVAYVNHPLSPRMNPLLERDGWWTWFDQFAYWQAAAEMAQYQLSAAYYYYPLGYPLLGALGSKLSPMHPFFWPNLALVVAIAWVSWRLWRLWFSRVGSLIVAVAFVCLHASLLSLTLVVPWNTIPTQFTLLAGIWLLITKTGGRSVVWLAGLAAVTYVVRPGDAACFAPLLVWSVLRLQTWRERITSGMAGIGIVVTIVVAVGLVNLAVFGNWNSPYERLSFDAVGFSSYPTNHQWFWLLVDGSVFFDEEGTALLFRYPWLLLILPGAIWWVRHSNMNATAALVTLTLSWSFYSRYNDFVPSGIFRYGSVHYVSWGLPLWFGLGFAVVRHGWRDWPTQIACGATALLAVLLTGMQLVERALPAEVTPGHVHTIPSARPLWVKFPGEPLTRVSELQLDGRGLQESRDYHIPYVPADLRLLLGSPAQGSQLILTGSDVIPQVGDYTWGWRWEPARWWPPRD